MRKLWVATAAFLMIGLILASYSIGESNRLSNQTDRYVAHQIEQGAALYQMECATCHGVNGKAEACVSANGEQIGCTGRALHTVELIACHPSPRMEAMSWLGSKYGFINHTIMAGRTANGMPAFGRDYGGSLSDSQIEQLTRYILNWETDGFAHCQPTPKPPDYWPTDSENLPEGNMVDGKSLYDIAYGCIACHGDPDEWGSHAVGPWVGDFVRLSEQQIPLGSDQTVQDFIMESILEPNANISPECPTGPCPSFSAMPDNFGNRMTVQDLADVLAYILANQAKVPPKEGLSKPALLERDRSYPRPDPSSLHPSPFPTGTSFLSP